MNISRIKIHNFKCITDLELNFDDIKGFWEIEGITGAGKTTIGEAILFGLFGSVRDKNNSDLIMWGEKRAEIELWCESKNHKLYIHRVINMKGQSPIDATVDGSPIVFTNKRDAQQQLESEYYDVSRLMLETLCIISFNGFKSLSSMNTKSTNEFLDDAFGFNVITNYTNVATDLQKQEARNLTKLTTDAAVISRQIDGYKEWRKKDENITVDMVEAANKNIKELEVQYKDKKQALLDKYNQLVQVTSDLKQERDALKIKQTEVKTKGSNIKKNIDFISKGICPTCGAPLDQSHIQEHQAERESLLQEYKSLQVQIDTKNKEIEEQLKLVSDHDSEMQKTCETITNKIQSQQRVLDNYKSQIEQQKKFTVEIDKLEDELAALNKKKTDSEVSFQEWLELISILQKNVKIKIMGALVPTINYYIGLYNTRLGQPYIVKFDENFNCHIQIAGIDEPISVKSLSTGQLKIVDMIIILSVLKTLLSNVAFNIVFLDELLNNMDFELRDTMCDLLRENMSPNQTMFIISHAPLNADILDGKIKVDYKNKRSSYNIVRM